MPPKICAEQREVVDVSGNGIVSSIRNRSILKVLSDITYAHAKAECPFYFAIWPTDNWYLEDGIDAYGASIYILCTIIGISNTNTPQGILPALLPVFTTISLLYSCELKLCAEGRYRPMELGAVLKNLTGHGIHFNTEAILLLGLCSEVICS